MGLLSGLEKFGFKSLDKVKVYEDTKKNDENAGNKKKAIADLTEPEMLFEKSYKCPACEKELKVKTLRQGKAKLLGTELDMRPKYQNIDPLKYGAILCRSCGYAALTQYFNTLSDPQIRLIKENVTRSYSPDTKPEGDMFTYDEALEIHKMALLSAVVKRGKSSEKAYICLKTAWLLRGKAEMMQEKNPDAKEELEKLHAEEKECLTEAYKGFISAIETESTSTICGMDGATVSYLCAALAYEIGEYEEAQRMISRIYGMSSANRRIKEKCTDLKELILQKTKQKS